MIEFNENAKFSIFISDDDDVQVEDKRREDRRVFSVWFAFENLFDSFGTIRGMVFYFHFAHAVALGRKMMQSR